MNLVSDWENGNLRTLNGKKNKSMKIYSMRKCNDLNRLEIKANNEAIEEGLYIDCQLLWEDQICNIFLTISKRLFL